MDEMVRVWEGANGDLEGCEDFIERTVVQRETLLKDMDKYSKDRAPY
jgi:hypothetical protein